MALARSTKQLDLEGKAEKTRASLHGLPVEPGQDERRDGWWDFTETSTMRNRWTKSIPNVRYVDFLEFTFWLDYCI